MLKLILYLRFDEIIDRLKDIKSLGYVKALRSGDTGIGYTLEHLLKIKENNIPLPDLGKIEIKAHRENSNSRITLFTYDGKDWKISKRDLITQINYTDKFGRLGLKCTVNTEPNSFGLYLRINDEYVQL